VEGHRPEGWEARKGKSTKPSATALSSVSLWHARLTGSRRASNMQKSTLAGKAESFLHPREQNTQAAWFRI